MIGLITEVPTVLSPVKVQTKTVCSMVWSGQSGDEQM
jgi:hypothetical protein